MISQGKVVALDRWGGKWNHLSMTHRLITNYAKNYCNRTLIVKVIIENVVICFLGGQSVCKIRRSLQVSFPVLSLIALSQNCLEQWLHSASDNTASFHGHSRSSCLWEWILLYLPVLCGHGHGPQVLQADTHTSKSSSCFWRPTSGWWTANNIVLISTSYRGHQFSILLTDNRIS